MPWLDSILIERIQKGDRQSAEKLFEKHREKAYRYAYRLTKHPEDAQDLLEDAYLRALGAIARFQHRCAFSTWLNRILKNCFLDAVKTRKVNVVMSLDQVVQKDEYRVCPQLKDGSVDVEKEVLDAEAAEEFMRNVDLTGKRTARILRLYYVHQYTYDEIAAMEQIPVGTVKSRLNRAREVLAKRMKYSQFQPVG